ncbi:DUF500 and UBA/TS-N domain protein [Aspergillus saccharolyticus JOP 1030-1]|uniref:DUF500-domain-containing protein n=1 Tax=Aspergillus saccharolyticus JOP 1030-1 TaxID=1450539 RepID=A0A318ZN06_9EURO|nr:DUF500-domain-containing protein [Aspergillus saccharolyticus JOP 1030-1]PYH48065.1 DUF500-domain-containing protein [Aspergillus saccharolyticus JOP 1030-1]
MSQPQNNTASSTGKMWDKTKVFGKKTFDKGWEALDKLGGPVNRLSNKLGAEAFWPMSIDKECDKAARILRSFCKDGVYIDAKADSAPPVSGSEASAPNKPNKEPSDKPRGKQKVLKKIPAEVVRQAKGLAIFTAMRWGWGFSGAGGSGILIARDPQTGAWTEPSGILLHTAGVGFLAGADIYDCVMVINTYEALEAFTKLRVTLGSEVSVAAGPVGMGGVVESEVHKRRAPIWTYMKSKGLYGGIQIDGSIIVERCDENEKFYGRRVPVKDILAGQVRSNNASVRGLVHTIQSAAGQANFDQPPADAQIPTGPSPSDIPPEQLANSNMFHAQAPGAPPPEAVQHNPEQYQVPPNSNLPYHQPPPEQHPQGPQNPPMGYPQGPPADAQYHSQQYNPGPPNNNASYSQAPSANADYYSGQGQHNQVPPNKY